MHDEDNTDNIKSVAEESLEIAGFLVGMVQMSDQEFLAKVARSDRAIDNDGSTCGMSFKMLLEAAVAREMIEAGEYEDVVKKWTTESQRRWREGKFFKLWQEAAEAGLDPEEEFAKRGWGT